MAIDKKFQEGYVEIMIPNVKVKWAKLKEPDTAFGANKWSIDCMLEDKELIAAYKELGFNVRDKKNDKGEVIAKDVLTLKREVITKKGQQEPPKVVGLDGKTPFTEDVGNGSVCNVKGLARAWKIKGQWTMGLYLEAVQVIDHVEKNSASFEDLTQKSEDVPF